MPSAPLRCFKHPLFPIFQLGFAFYLILTSFQSCSVIQEVVLQSAAQLNGTSTISEHAGYYSLAIIYAVLTFCNLFASPLVLLLTAKWSMVIGAMTNVLYLSSFLYLKTELLYAASAVLGFGSALLWVGQGNYITLASDSSNVGRNGAIVWAIFQLSLPTGGFFLYSQFSKSGDEIDPCTVKTIFVIFTFLSTFGCLNFALLKPLKVSSEDGAGLLEYAGESNSPSVDSVAVTSIQPTVSIFGEAIRTLKMLKSGKMILLAIVFYYSGALLTFWSAVYGTSLSFTRQFLPPTKLLLALNAIFIGFGETSGAVMVSLFNSKIEAYGRPVVIITGAFVNFLSFFVVFLMIPALAPLAPTDHVSYIAPNEYLAMGCSFLFGFGDSCWNTQIYATLSKQFASESTRTFSLFKFVQSLAAAIAFSYSSRLLMHWQLAILSLLCFLAAMAYCKVENYGIQQQSMEHEKPI